MKEQRKDVRSTTGEKSVTRIYPLVAVTLLYDRLGVEKISLSRHSTFELTFEWTLFFMTDSTVSIVVD